VAEGEGVHALLRPACQLLQPLPGALLQQAGRQHAPVSQWMATAEPVNIALHMQLLQRKEVKMAFFLSRHCLILRPTLQSWSTSFLVLSLLMQGLLLQLLLLVVSRGDYSLLYTQQASLHW
jgi:hypothetical protein